MIPAWNTRVGEFFKNIWWMTAREMGPVGRHQNIINKWKCKQWSSYRICRIKKRSSVNFLSLFLLFPNQKFVMSLDAFFAATFLFHLSLNLISAEILVPSFHFLGHSNFSTFFSLGTFSTAWAEFKNCLLARAKNGLLKIEVRTARLLTTTLAFFLGWFLFYGAPGGEPCF